MQNIGWEIKEGRLERLFTFTDFAQALAFVNRVGRVAEEINHHPDIHLVNYNKVLISTSTHDAGKVTQKDYDLANKIDQKISSTE